MVVMVVAVVVQGEWWSMVLWSRLGDGGGSWLLMLGRRAGLGDVPSATPLAEHAAVSPLTLTPSMVRAHLWRAWSRGTRDGGKGANASI